MMMMMIIIIITIITSQRFRVVRGSERIGFEQHVAVLMGAVREPELNHKGTGFIEIVPMRLTTKKTKFLISQNIGHL